MLYQLTSYIFIHVHIYLFPRLTYIICLNLTTFEIFGVKVGRCQPQKPKIRQIFCHFVCWHSYPQTRNKNCSLHTTNGHTRSPPYYGGYLPCANVCIHVLTANFEETDWIVVKFEVICRSLTASCLLTRNQEGNVQVSPSFMEIGSQKKARIDCSETCESVQSEHVIETERETSKIEESKSKVQTTPSRSWLWNCITAVVCLKVLLILLKKIVTQVVILILVT